MKDLPQNTHLVSDYLVSFENLERILGAGRSTAWREFNYFAYLQRTDGANISEVEKKIQNIRVSLPNQDDLTFGELRLQPITAVHFEHSRGNLKPSYDRKYLYIFLAVAISVLVITVMNYLNLATMLSLRRSKEIGVRRSIGATRRQILTQFITENIGITITSLVIGFILLELLSPVATSVLGYSFHVPYSDVYFLPSFIILATILGIITGATNRLNIPGIKNALIFVQFALSFGLITSSIVISKQMHFISNKDLGFEQHHVINVSMGKDITPTQLSSLKTELRKLPDVSAVASSDFTPGRTNWNQTIWWEGQTEEQSMFLIGVDQDFVKAMGIGLVEGNYEDLQSEDKTQYVINEAAMKAIGWDQAKGKMISPFGERAKLPVAAVVKDFNYFSLHQAVQPLVLVVSKERSFARLSVLVAPGDINSRIEQIKNTYDKITGGLPFEFSFMDDTISQLYNAELQMNAVVMMLTVVAVVFAFLGIYALISFSIENRTKEIAVRKVLGVSPISLLSLFSGSYLKIAVVAAVVAIPVCWSILNTWLGQFTYKIDIEPLWFAGSLVAVMMSISFVAFLKYTAMRQINPATSLKHE
jgi:putative ABC transport system permease protein